MISKVSLFITEGFHPFTTANEPAFIQLIQSCLQASSHLTSQFYVPDRKQVVSNLESRFEVYKTELLTELNTTEYVSITADIWKSGKR